MMAGYWPDAVFHRALYWLGDDAEVDPNSELAEEMAARGIDCE